MFAGGSRNDDDSVVLRGEAAGLEGLRVALSHASSSGVDASAARLLQAALEPFLREADYEEGTIAPPSATSSSNPLPLYKASVILSWQTESEEENDSCVKEGTLIVTQRACLFCAKALGTSAKQRISDHDWYVPGVCISLHALAETAGNVYLQINMDMAHDVSAPVEWTVETANRTDDEATDLYNALSRLVSLHPIDPHEETNQLGPFVGNEDDYFEPDEMIWAADIRDEDDGDISVTEEEREAMLDRLDRVLIIPPEYEIPDEQGNGQFDDAEEDEDDDIL